MIRVLQVIDKMSVQGSGLHGIARALAWWCARLDPLAFQVHILSLRQPEPEAEALFHKAGITLTFASLSKFDPRTLGVILREARACQADLLHLHGYAAHHFGRLAGRVLKIPVIVHEHVAFPKQALYLNVADRLLAPLTTHALAISEPVATFMRGQRHIPADRLETFFYGIPFDEWAEPDADAVSAARAEAGIQPGDTVISTIGRLAAQKDLPCLLEAFAHLLPQHPHARLLIVGEGPERPTVQRLAQTLQITTRVFLAGFRTDVRPWLALSDLFVIPSRYEGGPLTLFEAMRLGKPVVATPVGLVPEALHDGENGFLVPIGDRDALAARLSTLLADPALRARMGAAARRESDRWDVQIAVARLADVYRRLVPHPRPAKITVTAPEGQTADAADIATASADYAGRFAGPVGAWMLDVQRDIVANWLRPFPGASILDVGGGHAQLAIPLMEAGHQVTVHGSAAGCADRLRPHLEAGRLRFVESSMFSLPFANDSFDVVICIRLLPHCREWHMLVHELCRVARHAVIVDYPTWRSVNVVAGLLFTLKKRIEGNTRPYRLFHHEEVRRAFRACGFHPLASRGQFTAPMALHRLLRNPTGSRRIEAACRFLRLDRLFGSPVLLMARNDDATGGAP